MYYWNLLIFILSIDLNINWNNFSYINTQSFEKIIFILNNIVSVFFYHLHVRVSLFSSLYLSVLSSFCFFFLYLPLFSLYFSQIYLLTLFFSFFIIYIFLYFYPTLFWFLLLSLFLFKNTNQFFPMIWCLFIKKMPYIAYLRIL